MRATAIYYALAGGAVISVGAAVVVARNPDLLPQPLRSRLIESRVNSAPPIAAPKPTTSAPTTPSVGLSPLARAETTPIFDIIRVERDGAAVVAGHADPGDRVELRDGDRLLATAVADDAGQFVFVPDALGPGAHALRLSAISGARQPRFSSPSPIEVAPQFAAKSSEPKQGLMASAAKPPAFVAPLKPMDAPATSPKALVAMPPAVATPEPARSLPLAPAIDTTLLKAQVAPAPQIAEPPKASQPIPIATGTAPPLVLATKPLAPVPSATAPGASRLSVMRVDAAESGRLEANGVAEPGAKLRLTLNGAYLANVAASADGRWSLTIQSGMTAGLYALEAEVLGLAGAARAKASFTYPRHPPSGGALIASSKSSIETAPPSMSMIDPEAAKSEPNPPSISPAHPIPLPAPVAAKSESASADIAKADTSAQAVVVAVEPPRETRQARIAAAPQINDPSHAVVARVRTTVVVYGDNLWDLARKFYNDGTRYSDIYAANHGQIRDPRLIYIGQIFVVPQPNPQKP